MNLEIGDILSRAWRITWRHKALWLLGFLVALPGGTGNGVSAGSRFQARGDGAGLAGGDGLGSGLGRLGQGLPEGLRTYLEQLVREFTTLRQSVLLTDRPWLLPVVVLLVIAALFLLWLLLAMIGLVARTGLVRSIDAIDAGAPAPSLRQAWRLGWSTRSVRLLLAEILMGLLSLILILPVIALAVLVGIVVGVDAMGPGSDGSNLWAILAAVAVVLGGVLLVAVMSGVLNVLRQLWTREIIVADAPIGAAVASAVATMRRHPGGLLRCWLALLLVGLAIGLASLPISLVMAVSFAGMGLGLGAMIKVLLGGLLGAFSGLISLVTGLVFSAFLFSLPLAAFQGLIAVFTTSAWTLAWRRLRGDGPPPPKDEGAPTGADVRDQAPATVAPDPPETDRPA